jgi:phosphatidylinositol-3-phosphatase
VRTNASLAHRCGLAANYHHNARVSLPNYLAMTSGSTHGLRRNCTPKQCPVGGPSIFTQLTRRHRSWKAYQESPRGSGALNRALNDRGTPAYMFVTPNLCHDMHDCSVAVGDRWISRWVRMMVRSRAYRAGHTAIFLTFDEGSNQVGRIPTVVVSPYTHAGTVSHRRYTHFSLMRTTARVLGIRRCLGKACSARGLSKAFRL